MRGAVLFAVLIVAGALTACAPGVPPGGLPSGAPLAADEAPAATIASEPDGSDRPEMSERCEAWIAWLIDNNRGGMVVRVPRVALENIGKDCLGRFGRPFTPSPIPPPPEPGPDADAEPEPEPEPANLIPI